MSRKIITTEETEEDKKMKMNEWYEEGILDPQFGTRTTEDINGR